MQRVSSSDLVTTIKVYLLLDIEVVLHPVSSILYEVSVLLTSLLNDFNSINLVFLRPRLFPLNLNFHWPIPFFSLLN